MSAEIRLFIETVQPVKTKRNDIILSITPKPYEHVLLSYGKVIENTESFLQGDYIHEVPPCNTFMDISEFTIDLNGKVLSSGLRRKVNSDGDTDKCYASISIGYDQAKILIKQIDKDTEQLIIIPSKLLKALQDAIFNHKIYFIQQAVVIKNKVVWKDLDSNRNLFHLRLKINKLDKEKSYRLISHEKDGTIIHHGWE